MGFFFAQVAYFLILDVVWCGVVWCGLWFLWFLRGYLVCALFMLSSLGILVYCQCLVLVLYKPTV